VRTVKDQERLLISVRNVMGMVLFIVQSVMAQESINAYFALGKEKKNAIAVMVGEEGSALIVAVADMTYGEKNAPGAMERVKSVVPLVMEPAMKNASPALGEATNYVIIVMVRGHSFAKNVMVKGKSQ
jgi:hypothetical protein